MRKFTEGLDHHWVDGPTNEYDDILNDFRDIGFVCRAIKSKTYVFTPKRKLVNEIMFDGTLQFTKNNQLNDTEFMEMISELIDRITDGTYLIRHKDIRITEFLNSNDEDKGFAQFRIDIYDNKNLPKI